MGKNKTIEPLYLKWSESLDISFSYLVLLKAFSEMWVPLCQCPIWYWSVASVHKISVLPKFPCIKIMWAGISLSSHTFRIVLFPGMSTELLCQACCQHIHTIIINSNINHLKERQISFNSFFITANWNSVIYSFDWIWIYFCSYKVVLFYTLFFYIIAKIAWYEKFLDIFPRSSGKKCQFDNFKDLIHLKNK